MISREGDLAVEDFVYTAGRSLRQTCHCNQLCEQQCCAENGQRLSEIDRATSVDGGVRCEICSLSINWKEQFITSDAPATAR